MAAYGLNFLFLFRQVKMIMCVAHSIEKLRLWHLHCVCLAACCNSLLAFVKTNIFSICHFLLWVVNTCKIKINIRRQSKFSFHVAAQSKKCSCQTQRDSAQLRSCSTDRLRVLFTMKTLQAPAEPRLPCGISSHVLQIQHWHQGFWWDLHYFSLPCTKHVRRSQWIYQNSLQPKKKKKEAFPFPCLLWDTITHTTVWAGAWLAAGSGWGLQLFSLASPMRYSLHLSNTLSFPTLLFFFSLGSSVELSPWNNLLWSIFQPIVWHSFVCSFLDIFSLKAPHSRRTTHCWSCIFSTETPHAFHADKREDVWPVLIPELSLWCSLGPSPRKVEDLNI